MKTSELTGVTLDWAVLKAQDQNFTDFNLKYMDAYPFSTDWAQGGPIIEQEGISVIKLAHEYGTDSKGYTTRERIPVFGAVIGEYFDTDQQRNSYGESWGDIYYIGEDIVTTGPTPLIAAMRCFVASKLGNDVEVPKELEIV